MREFKQHKKMYKSGKFWVVAGLTVVSLITANDTNKVFDLFGDRLGSVFAAQTNSSATIDTVTDADTATGSSRYVQLNTTTTNTHTEYAGKGTYNGTVWSAESSSYKDPATQTYAKLTANGQNTIGYYYVNRQFDASMKFTIDGYFHPNLGGSDGTLPSNGNWSDWVGLVLTPTDPGKMATDYNMANGGGGLGIQGFGNALAFGLDFYQNSGDPAAGPFGALRTTNSSGALNSVPDAMYTKGQNLTSWTTTIKYQLTWNPTGGPGGGPYISASLKDTNGHSWTINTNNAGITLNPPKSFSVGVNAANGQKANDNFASINNLSGTFNTGTTTVKYVDANGNAIKDPTTFVAAVGDIIGISGLSSGAKAGTDDIAFAAPTIRGYTAGSANDVTVSQTDGNNVITIKYKGTVQQEAIVNTNKPELWNGSRTGWGNCVFNASLGSSY